MAKALLISKGSEELSFTLSRIDGPTTALLTKFNSTLFVLQCDSFLFSLQA